MRFMALSQQQREIVGEEEVIRLRIREERSRKPGRRLILFGLLWTLILTALAFIGKHVQRLVLMLALFPPIGPGDGFPLHHRSSP